MARNSLRDSSLKRALTAYIIPIVCKKYQVIAVRALFDSKLIWGKRIELEKILESNEKVVAFFSAITALDKHVGKKRKATEMNGTYNILYIHFLAVSYSYYFYSLVEILNFINFTNFRTN